MGQLHIQIFSTLDGVAQAPGHPDEDPEGGFAFGGWQAPISGDEVEAREVVGLIEGTDALLLGRKTYDIFAGYWPDEVGPVASVFNTIPKYVVTRGRSPLPWQDSTALTGDDLTADVEALRARHEKICVFGSLELSRALIERGLFDRLDLWVFPIVLGRGKRLFAEGTTPAGLRLLEDPIRTTLGGVLLRYGPGEPPVTGDMRESAAPID